MENYKKAYSQILNLLKKHKDLHVFDIDSLERTAKNHLFRLELNHIYGLNIDPKSISSTDWIKIDEYRSIALWGKERGRTISWSFNKMQPENEILFSISFSTGPYIFGDDYPKEFFNQFWEELKTYKWDYLDDVNHSIYWKLENAKTIFNSFRDILDKYSKLNNEDIKRRKIEKLKKELERLENKK